MEEEKGGKDQLRMCVCVVSHILLFRTPWTGALQTPQSMVFSKQEYWSRGFLGIFSPGDLLNPGIEATSFVFSTLAGRFFITGPPGNDEVQLHKCCLRCQASVTQQCSSESNLYLFHPRSTQAPAPDSYAGET